MSLTTIKASKREISISAYQTKYNSKIELYKDYTILVGSLNLSPVLTIFSKRGFKPIENFRFTSYTLLNSHLEKFKSNVDKSENRIIEMLEDCKIKKQAFVVGTILCSTWGYEQTNVDFYMILERKNDFVTLVQIGKNKTFDKDDSGKCVADTTKVLGEPFKKKISKYASINLSSYKSCSLWDGSPIYWSSYC